MASKPSRYPRHPFDFHQAHALATQLAQLTTALTKAGLPRTAAALHDGPLDAIGWEMAANMQAQARHDAEEE